MLSLEQSSRIFIRFFVSHFKNTMLSLEPHQRRTFTDGKKIFQKHHVKFRTEITALIFHIYQISKTPC